MAKLSPDYIQFVLSLKTDQAQQEIHKLDKASKELKNENKELRKSMNDLIASGKSNSDEYRNLEKQYRKNNQAIAENKAKTDQLVKAMDNQNKSYKQLSKEAKLLKYELDNTVQALEPERYAQLAEQLEKVKERMKELRGTSTGTQGSFDKLATVMRGTLAQVGFSITQTIGNTISQAKQFASESMDLATSADGVLHAFEQLGRADLLPKLREQTKGTVSDLQLMTSLVRARDFRIPLDDMGKFLAFAQLKAQQTGQSVDYMVDSIVTGLGRQSLLILDNLGLSAAEIREKVAETGDFMQGVAAIVDKQLQQAGQYVSAADQVAAADVKMENAKLKLGKALSWLGDLQVRFKSGMADLVNSVLSSASDKYEEQKAKVISLVTETQPLIDRYDTLKSKISLTATEQEELNGVIGKIAQAMPGVISQIGEYGKVLDINSGSARKFIETQKQLMLYDNRKAIAEAEKKQEEYRKKFNRANSILQNGGRSQFVQTSSFGTGQYVWNETPELLSQAAQEASQYKALLDRETDRLKELRGENLESLIESQQKQRAAREQFLKMNRKQLQAWLDDEKNANSEYRDMALSTLATKPSDSLSDKKKETIEKEEKLQEKISEQLLSLCRKSQQDEINLRKEGTEKKLAQIDLDYKKEIDAIDKQREEWKKAQKDKLTAEQEAQLETAKEYALKVKNKKTDDVNKEKSEADQKAWQAYYIEFGSYQEKRKNLILKYNDEIAKASEDGVKESLKKRLEKELQALDFSEIKKGIDWEKVFGNLDKVATESLKSLKDKLKEFVASQEGLSPENMKEIVSAIERIDDKIKERNPFKTLSASFKTLKEATDSERKAQESYNKALEKGTDEEKKNAKATLESAKNARQKALSEATDALHRGTAEVEQYVEAGNQIIGIMETLGVKTPKWLNEFMGGFGEILNGLEKIDLMKPMSIVTGGLQAVKGALTSVVSMGGLISFGADYSQYNDMVAKYEDLLDIWGELLDAKRAYIQESYGAEAIKAGNEALQVNQNLLDVEKKLAEARLNSGKGMFSHSQRQRMWRGKTKWEGKNWRDVASDVESGLSDAGLGDVSFTNMDSLISMSSDQLQWIKENYAGLWSVMDDDFREHLEHIIDFGETEKDILEAVKEQMTGITFDEFENSYLSMLTDLETSNEDFANDFEKKLQQSILQSLLSTKYKEQIRKLYDSWAAYGEDGYTKDEVEQLKEIRQNLTESMLKEREELASLFGWDKNSSADSFSQSGSRGTFDTMTQDQSSEMNGRLTALQESGYRREELLEALLQNQVSNYECITEIRDILYESNDYLGKIEDYTSLLKSMSQYLERINKNTKNL